MVWMVEVELRPAAGLDVAWDGLSYGVGCSSLQRRVVAGRDSGFVIFLSALKHGTAAEAPHAAGLQAAMNEQHQRQNWNGKDQNKEGKAEVSSQGFREVPAQGALNGGVAERHGAGGISGLHEGLQQLRRF